MSGELKDGDKIYKYYFSKNANNELIERKCIVNAYKGHYGFILKDPVLGTSTHYRRNKARNIVLLVNSNKKKALNIMRDSYLKRREAIAKDLEHVNLQIDFLDNKIKELP